MLEGGGVGVEGVGPGEEEQVAAHVDDDETDKGQPGEGHEVLAAQRRSHRTQQDIHSLPFPDPSLFAVTTPRAS